MAPFFSNGNQDGSAEEQTSRKRTCIPVKENPEWLTTRIVLPTSREPNHPAPIPSKDVTKIALRLKYQIETVIPCEVPEDAVTNPLSSVLTPKVIQTAKEAGGVEHRACVAYCLLVCKRWFTRQAKIELWDADLHEVRGVACEILAKRMCVSCRSYRHEQATELTSNAVLKEKKTKTTFSNKSCFDDFPLL